MLVMTYYTTHSQNLETMVLMLMILHICAWDCTKKSNPHKCYHASDSDEYDGKSEHI
jgi:hypothetical protein